MLKARVITALVLLAILLPILFFLPPQALYFVLSIVIGLASWEWSRLLWLNINHYFHKLYAAIIVLILYVIWWLGASNLIPDYFYLLQIGTIFFAFIFWVLFVPMMMRKGLSLDLTKVRLILSVSGIFLFIACWFSLAILRELGLGIFLSVLIWVWAADIGAYFSGKGFGKRKLAPSLSPGKTIEGMLGGLFLVLFVSLFFVMNGYWQLNYFSLIYQRVGLVSMLLIVIAGVLLSVVGDLFESQLKRLANVKDSSALLPGHGGFLDRIDALLPVLPFAALVILVLS
jgi:phosphatidate cytidylyltransferase